MSSAVVVLVLAVICLGPCVHSLSVNGDLVVVRCRSSPSLFVYMKNSVHPQTEEAYRKHDKYIWYFDVANTTDVSHIESAVITCDSLPPKIKDVVVLGAWVNLSGPRPSPTDQPILHYFSTCGIVRKVGPSSIPPRQIPVWDRSVTGSSIVGPTESIACYLSLTT